MSGPLALSGGTLSVGAQQPQVNDFDSGFWIGQAHPLDLVAATTAMTDPNPTLDEILSCLLDAQ